MDVGLGEVTNLSISQAFFFFLHFTTHRVVQWINSHLSYILFSVQTPLFAKYTKHFVQPASIFFRPPFPLSARSSFLLMIFFFFLGGNGGKARWDGNWDEMGFLQSASNLESMGARTWVFGTPQREKYPLGTLGGGGGSLMLMGQLMENNGFSCLSWIKDNYSQYHTLAYMCTIIVALSWRNESTTEGVLAITEKRWKTWTVTAVWTN